MIETIGAGTLIYGPSQAERAAALKAALPDLARLRRSATTVGPDLLALAAGAPDADPRLAHEPGRRRSSPCSPRARPAR